MDKSVDKFPEGQTAQGRRAYPRRKAAVPAPAVITELIGLRIAPPKVQARELAAELGVTASQLSLFENHKDSLPNGMGPESYRAAVRRVREKRGEAVDEPAEGDAA